MSRLLAGLFTKMSTLAVVQVLFLAVALVFSAPTSKHFECSLHNVARLSAVLDYSGFDPKSGYFSVVNASIVDNYNYGQLTCIGNSFDNEINCVGFDNGVGTIIFYVSVPPGGKYASYRMLMGQPGPLAGRNWTCSVLP